MEDVKAFIESGILELYVLGDITAAEREQVEAMVQEHPAVKAELNEVEKALEMYASVNAMEPSAHQRTKILNSLVTNLADDNTFKTKNTEATVVELPLAASNTTNFYKYAFAASVALLLGSIVAIYGLNNKLEEKDAALVAASLQNQKFSKTVDYMDNELGVFRDSSYKVIRLKGTDNLPTGSLLVAWSPAKQKVMIDLKSLDMPVNDKDHQYQLWALVNGKPVDLGVFDKIAGDTVTMQEMKSIASAQAFAVTREPRGGSVNPTMSEMMIIGQFETPATKNL
ncbi:anti-sigma factor domain-containing protein [Mucilaginibacter antarcticus]|uniref:Regulator of SigK n=1 Tax=Mucilaginibacter antarcticus TaxID=1855725 RepID=A0ABW5XNF1_9SPHI